MIVNAAAENGPIQFDWWPDWRGQRCAIVASGPSTKLVNLQQLRGRVRVMAIKTNVDLCPWADVVYGCDAHWWQHRRGLPDFKGLKLFYGPPVIYPGLHKIHIEREHDKLLLKKPGEVGNGGNSGFQAVNLAVGFGAIGIALIGYDMIEHGNSPHWYGRNDWPGCANPLESNYARWRRALEGVAPTLAELGVDVVNCSTQSGLGVYRKQSLEATLEQWGV